MIILDDMGHLYSTVSLAEIYNFAVNLMGLKPEWNHLGNLFPHWDLTTSRMKTKARSLGATYIDSRSAIERGNYNECRAWFKILVLEEKSRNNVFFYQSTGLAGQKILRIDYSKLKHRI